MIQTFDEYQKFIITRASKGNSGLGHIYSALGLAGETGEVVEIIKKACRREDKNLNEKEYKDIILEMGDVLYYLSNMATELNINFSDIVSSNIDKLNNLYENKNPNEMFT